MVNGIHFVRRTQYMVSYLSAIGVSKQLLSQWLRKSFAHYNDHGLHFVLHHVAFDSLLPVSTYFGHFLSLMESRSRNVRPILILGTSVCSCSCHSLWSQSEVDLWLVQTNRETLDGNRTKSSRCPKWIVNISGRKIVYQAMLGLMPRRLVGWGDHSQIGLPHDNQLLEQKRKNVCGGRLPVVLLSSRRGWWVNVLIHNA